MKRGCQYQIDTFSKHKVITHPEPIDMYRSIFRFFEFYVTQEGVGANTKIYASKYEVFFIFENLSTR